MRTTRERPSSDLLVLDERAAPDDQRARDVHFWMLREKKMKRADSNSESVLDKLLECTTRGAQVALTLRNGQKISGFRVHEVIAPQGQQRTLDRRDARARGIVRPDHGPLRDEYVQVRDIESVRDERLPPYGYFASEEFFHRHPLPPNWVRLARCPTGPKK